MKPLLWMRALRDLGELPTSRLAVLWALGLRMNPDGSGFTSTRQLAEDAAVSHSTVERSTRWGREHEWLERVKRGHRLGDGRTVATSWRLSQPVTGDTLSESQPVTTASQSVTGVTPEVSIPEVSTPTPVTYSTTEGQPNGSRNGGKESQQDTHPHEPNARRALAALRADRALPVTEDVLLDLAYAVAADPWQGYLSVKAATEQTLAGARDPVAVVRKRLGVAS